jgi:hypothetical protein
MELTSGNLDRRRFFRKAGFAGLGVAAAASILNVSTAEADAQTQAPGFQSDTPPLILTAALIAEDLATTFYYNTLVGAVAQDAALIGPGGTLKNPSTLAGAINVSYLRAALGQEFTHANLLRSLLSISGPAASPVQTFYFPTGTFDVLKSTGTAASMTSMLLALENAFIGAYLTAVRAFAYMAAQTSGVRGNYYSLNGTSLGSDTLGYYAQVSASIMGVESEHRALGRDIAGLQANNLNYESTDGLDGVYSGPNSAVVALTPFLTASTGKAYNLSDAIANMSSLVITSTDAPPPQ